MAEKVCEYFHPLEGPDRQCHYHKEAGRCPFEGREVICGEMD